MVVHVFFELCKASTICFPPFTLSSHRAVHATLQTSAANILSERGLPMILDMLRVRDFDVQYACTRALLHLIRHNGEVGWNACFLCVIVAVCSFACLFVLFVFRRLRKPHQSCFCFCRYFGL